VQVSVKVLLVLVSDPVLALPTVARLPLQPPLAVQLVALVEDQFRVALPPVTTVFGLTASVSVGAGDGGALTMTLALWLAEPPEPVQVSVNVLLVAVSGPVLTLPDVGRAPLQPPLAMQLVELADDQASVAAAPLSITPGVADRFTVGAAAGGDAAALTMTLALWLAAPPAPVQVSVNVLFAAVRPPVPALPEVGRLPLQAPLARQLLALLDDHVSVAPEPLATVAGLAVSVTAGAGAGGGASTETLAVRLAVPPAPSQVRENAVAAVSAPVTTLPDVG